MWLVDYEQRKVTNFDKSIITGSLKGVTKERETMGENIKKSLIIFYYVMCRLNKIDPLLEKKNSLRFGFNNQ